LNNKNKKEPFNTYRSGIPIVFGGLFPGKRGVTLNTQQKQFCSEIFLPVV
jgi:hypothetical protein